MYSLPYAWTDGIHYLTADYFSFTLPIPMSYPNNVNDHRNQEAGTRFKEQGAEVKRKATRFTETTIVEVQGTAARYMENIRVTTVQHRSN